MGYKFLDFGQAINDQLEKSLIEVLRSGFWSTGPQSKLLEESLSKIYQRPCVTTSSGGTALQTVSLLFPQIKKIHDWYVINFGNNHIAKSCEDIDGFDLKSAYRTERDNMLFNSVDSFNMSIFKICENSIKIRTYENGTGETLSCGSATISVAYALSFELGLNELTFKSLGGETKVYISNDGVASEASAEIIEEGFLNG